MGNEISDLFVCIVVALLSASVAAVFSEGPRNSTNRLQRGFYGFISYFILRFKSCQNNFKFSCLVLLSLSHFDIFYLPFLNNLLTKCLISF